MPNVGPLELVLVFVIALIVLGPKRLPEVGRSVGAGIREFKDSLNSIGSGDDDEDREDDPRGPMTTAATAPAPPDSPKP